MQPAPYFQQQLAGLASAQRYLFSTSDLRGLLPDMSSAAFKSILHRVVRDGFLVRVCRGLHLYPRVEYPKGLLLYHAAARLRAHQFNYLSLESVLSDAGFISQVPMQWITVMSSGRSSTVSCGFFGTIEFVHTRQTPEALAGELTYDNRCRLWRASTSLATRDMRNTRRSLDLLLTEPVS